MSSKVQNKPIRVPGPDHPITIEPSGSRVTVRAGGRVVAQTDAALTLREAAYAPVQYIPLEDVDRSLLTPSDHETYCPYKGDCSYYDLDTGADGENAVWEYRDPYPAVAQIKGHVAFYPNRVDSIDLG